MFYDHSGFYANYRVGHFAYLMHSLKNTLRQNIDKVHIDQDESDNMLIEANVSSWTKLSLHFFQVEFDVKNIISIVG